MNNKLRRTIDRMRDRMSYRQITLPVLRVTRRSTSGSKSLEVLHRGSGKEEYQENADSQLSTTSTPAMPLDNNPDFQLRSLSQELNEPTVHELERKANVAGWEKVRKEILNIGVGMEAMPYQQQCNICQKCSATIRCRRCGPFGYYCQSCFKDQHSKVNMFHIGETWEVNIIKLWYSLL